MLTPGFQIATVEGGVSECGDVDYPGLYVRLDDPQVFEFIDSHVRTQENASK
jgi:hypothetical protein